MTLAGNLLFQLAKPVVLRREAAAIADDAALPNAAPNAPPGRERVEYDAWNNSLASPKANFSSGNAIIATKAS